MDENTSHTIHNQNLLNHPLILMKNKGALFTRENILSIHFLQQSFRLQLRTKTS